MGARDLERGAASHSNRSAERGPKEAFLTFWQMPARLAVT
jgi:hypothetical protein